MANVKFSQFSATTISATGFIVGYDSALNDNIRFTLAQLQTAMTLNSISGTLTSSKGGYAYWRNSRSSACKDFWNELRFRLDKPYCR